MLLQIENLTLPKLQVIIPLGSKPGLRAGMHPQEDEQSYPPGGTVHQTLTDERVCVRKKPDLGALEVELKRLRQVSPGAILGSCRVHYIHCCMQAAPLHRCRSLYTLVSVLSLLGLPTGSCYCARSVPIVCAFMAPLTV